MLCKKQLKAQGGDKKNITSWLIDDCVEYMYFCIGFGNAKYENISKQMRSWYVISSIIYV